jgi:hypothetical protein
MLNFPRYEDKVGMDVPYRCGVDICMDRDPKHYNPALKVGLKAAIDSARNNLMKTRILTNLKMITNTTIDGA